MRLGSHQSFCSVTVAACLALGGVLGGVLGGDAPAAGAEAVARFLLQLVAEPGQGLGQ